MRYRIGITNSQEVGRIWRLPVVGKQTIFQNKPPFAVAFQIVCPLVQPTGRQIQCTISTH